jgi:comEA protein
MSKGPSESKYQCLTIIGLGLIILSVILFIYALSLPKISANSAESHTYYVTHASDDSESDFDVSGPYYVCYDGFNIDESSDSDENSYSEESSDSDESSYSDESSNSDVSVTYPLNLNTCTYDELITIDGIGDVKARSIIEYRDYIGGYTSVEQIKNISGIGDSVYEKVAPYLTV